MDGGSLAERDGSGALEAAAGLVPALAGRAEEAEELRRLPDATITDLEASGVLRLLTPQAYGGCQAPVGTYLRVIEELGRGCASTAFVASVYTGVSFVTCLLPDRAQEDVFSNENPRGIFALNPQGAATRTDGGFVLSGKWFFCSGQHHAGWALLSALTTRPDDTVDVGLFLVPRSACTAGGDWDVAGLAATGSDSLTVSEVFVPAHAMMLVSDLVNGRYESTLAQKDPYYQASPVAVATAGLAGTPLGAARRAMELFRAGIERRGITYTAYLRQADATVTHLQMAEASLLLDEARFHAERVLTTAQLGSELDTAARWRCRADAAWAIRRCKEVADIVESACGATALRRSDPLQRIIRDLHALSLHALMLSSTNTELYGRVLCGVDPGVPFA